MLLKARINYFQDLEINTHVLAIILLFTLQVLKQSRELFPLAS